MAKSKTKSSKKTRRKEGSSATLASVLQNIAKHEQQQSANVDTLVDKASILLQEESNPQQALKIITQALAKNPTCIPALELAGEINVELGDIPTAVQCFTKATQLDADG